MSKSITDKAHSGQTFFGLPAYIGTPTVTVNGTARPLTMAHSGIILNSPTNQDDVVKVTYDPAF